MNICPITYGNCDLQRYSSNGLKQLTQNLNDLSFPYSAEEQRQAAIAMASKISIQGVQIKLSAVLNAKVQQFQIQTKSGRYILKPQSPHFLNLPENEGLTMHLARVFGLDIPVCGMVYSKDHTFTYFIQRFDRLPKKQKLAVEDFAQLAGKSRDTKYDFSIERLVPILEKFCTFPVLEKQTLFQRILFNFLIGNEDAHLKNFSLITRNKKVELSPVYDLLNTTIVLKNPQEEIALPLNGKKKNLTQKILIDYLAKERLGLNFKIIDATVRQVIKTSPLWSNLIEKSFLPEILKIKYNNLLKDRLIRLGFHKNL